MKQKFIEWFTKNNNGCSPAVADDGSFESEKTQHMFEAYLAGVAESEAKCTALAAENAKLADCANFYRRGFTSVKGSVGIEYKPTEQLINDWGITALEALKTPATDRFIADVKAQGVEEFAEKCRDKVRQSISLAVSDSWCVTWENANEFAQQLREAK